MAVIDIRWENEAERKAVEQLNLDWLLYGEMHLTNAPRGHGLTRLDPRRITYHTGEMTTAMPTASLREGGNEKVSPRSRRPTHE